MIFEPSFEAGLTYVEIFEPSLEAGPRYVKIFKAFNILYFRSDSYETVNFYNLFACLFLFGHAEFRGLCPR